MKKIRKKMGNKLMCIVAMLVAFTAMFTIFLVQKNQSESLAAMNSTFMFQDYEGVQKAPGSEFTMRCKQAIYKLLPPTDGSIMPVKYEWSSQAPDIVKIASGAATSAPTLEVVKPGSAAINVDVTDPDGKKYPFTITVNVVFSISEYLNGTDNGLFKKIFDKDTRNALIMDYGKSLNIGGSDKDDTYLKLVYGEGTEAEWDSSDTDVIEVDKVNKTVKACGAGVAELSVSYHDKNELTKVYTDNIKVYVRPTKLTHVTSGAAIDITDISTTSAINAKKGDGIGIPVNTLNDIAVSNKISWRIEKGSGENAVLVRDSFGNKGDDVADAVFTYIDASKMYRLDFKSGTYTIRFYVAGTYNKDGTSSSTCQPVSKTIRIDNEFENKTVTINVGGSYNISEAFNLSEDVLNNNFLVEYGDDSSSQYITIPGKGENSCIIKADKNKTGTAVIKVTKTSNIPIDGVSINDGAIVYIRLTIVDTFNLNVSSTDLAIGAPPLNLYGVIGTKPENVNSDQFTWTIESGDASCISLSNTTGLYVDITAKKETAQNNPVVVALNWTGSDGIVRTARCTITVVDMPASFKITPNVVKLEVGETSTLSTGLSGQRSIVWMSSDISIVTVDSLAGNTKATITAGKKTGDAIITAYNEKNKTYATCKVTVKASVTSIKIDKGETYTVALAEQFVFMKAVYQPSNATETEFEWVSTDKAVATVDENGTVSLHKKGVTTIKVSPKATGTPMATCILTVTDKVMTSITADVTNLNMIRGETHQSTAKYLPVDATETNMTWTSLNTKVAKVSKDGLITAVGVGSTSIVVSANVAYDTTSNPNKFAQAVITVNVRNKLNSIKFASTPIYIAMGNSQKIDVIFNPENDINKNITWSISDTSIAKVSKDGVLTGVSEGIASLNVISEDLGGAGISTTVYVTPKPVYATNFVISPDKQTIHVGELLTLETNFSPKGVTEKNLEWSSSDPKIATVDEKGQVTAVAVGEAVITAVYSDAPNGKPITKTCTLTVEPPIVYATDFSVSPATKNIMVGQKFSITSEFTPKDTTNQNVIYQSLDEGVITVDSKGVVKGVGAGDAIVQCQTEDGGFIGTCAVHVDNAIKFSLSPSTREIAVGNSFTPAKVTKPANATKTATWKTSNISIAKVSSTGKITGRKIGNCTITCTLSYYNQSAKCIVKVRKLNSKVSFKNSSIRIGVGQTYRMKPTVWSNASKTPSLSWRTSNKRILTVSSSGKIKGKKVGIAKITAITRDRIHAKAVCRVRVIRRATSIALNTDYTVIYVGRSKKLTVRYRPSGTTVKKVKWKSGDSGIARVTASGHVRGIAEGNTYITATTVDGSNKRAKCYVKVLEPVPATSIVVAQSDMTVKRGDKAKISYTVLPNDTSDGLKFSSDNKRVATVNKKGVIHAVGTGTAKITILATSGVTSTVNVNVVALNKTSLNMRQYDTETLMVFGSTASVTWYSSNSRVATVSNGLVTGKGKGTAYIYAYINGCKLACKVTITSVNS